MPAKALSGDAVSGDDSERVTATCLIGYGS